MVFGNLGENSGTGVGFTRNPPPANTLSWRVPDERARRRRGLGRPHAAFHQRARARHAKVYDHLRAITWKMEKHYRDMQDFEFTIQDGKLYMLQTRNGKRTGLAAVRIAIDMVREGLISQEEAIFRVEPNSSTTSLFPPD